MKKITRILIVNRGEIAVRIIQSCQRLGIVSIAVFSDSDRDSLHVRLADEAYPLEGNTSQETYLNVDKILAACEQMKADAVHPGYGFLSENARFAAVLKKHNITFIGPSPEAIEIMGDKISARNLALENDIPLIPGTSEAVSSLQEALEAVKKIGLPAMIKASAGGGGKGMRIVKHENEVEEGIKRAISEAESAFGNGAVFIEKYITSPRHIELQVVADQHGNYVHLFERECSIQRRHQKVVEEAPSAILSEEKRAEMGACALRIAEAANYENLGTIEFIMDEELNYYFLEMNTRLQVEHPVTECITGLDLVELQIRIAEGSPLPFKQEDLKIQGHAFELRVYAEDPLNNFLPDIGLLTKYQLPELDGVRVDNAFEEGMNIPVYYDPMLSKLVVHASNRKNAIQLMLQALKEYKIEGVANTLSFGEFVFQHPKFITADFDTNFVSNYFNLESEEEELLASALVAALKHLESSPVLPNKEDNNWKERKQF